MADHNFGEKKTEYYAKTRKEIPVIVTAKFMQARQKAIEAIESGSFGLHDGDFWILMNTTSGSDKMKYNGLILSHNGCLKINDHLPSKFVPSCVSVDKQGFNNSLVYTYCNDEQGIYEVGEANAANCTNAYIYAMAYKRLFDRVVLKLSRLAYDGIYSDSESEEFREPDAHKADVEYEDPDDFPFTMSDTDRPINADEISKYFSSFSLEGLRHVCDEYKLEKIEDMRLSQLNDYRERVKAHKAAKK